MNAERDSHIHCARVFIAQARHFRLRGRDTGWPCTLLNWAARARRRATSEPAQRELFAGAR